MSPNLTHAGNPLLVLGLEPLFLLQTVSMKSGSSHEHSAVAQVLADPVTCANLPLRAWDRLLPQLRAAGVSARLGARLRAAGIAPSLPALILRHLDADRVLAAKQIRDVRWEIQCIQEALQPAALRLVLLKGASYVAADLPPAEGRLFGDIDILVPKSRLADAERALLDAGWSFDDKSEYDDRYYREHMHQLPPMMHKRRGTVIDVHHTLVPETSGIDLDSAKLLDTIRVLPNGAAVLAPADMVLHSAVHIFNEGSFDRAIRDLDDVTSLACHFLSTDPAFGKTLTARAAELDLMRPLFYASRWSRRLLNGPLDEPTSAAPSWPVRTLMDTLLARVLTSPHPDCRGFGSGFAEWLLYIRSHYLRMPLRLLLPHLLRKAIQRRVEEPDPTPAGPWPRDNT